MRAAIDDFKLRFVSIVSLQYTRGLAVPLLVHPRTLRVCECYNSRYYYSTTPSTAIITTTITLLDPCILAYLNGLTLLHSFVRELLQEGFVVTQYHETSTLVSFTDPNTGQEMLLPQSAFIYSIFSDTFVWHHRWVNVGVLVGFIAVAGLAVCLGLRFVRHVKR